MSTTVARRIAYFLVALIAIDLLYFYFPFPPAITRGCILVVLLFTILFNIKYGLNKFEKACIFLLIINLIHFTIGSISRTYSFTNITNTSIVMLSFPCFRLLANRGAFNEVFIKRLLLLLCLCCILYYNYKLTELMYKYGADDSFQATVNALSLIHI